MPRATKKKTPKLPAFPSPTPHFTCPNESCGASDDYLNYSIPISGSTSGSAYFMRSGSMDLNSGDTDYSDDGDPSYTCPECYEEVTTEAVDAHLAVLQGHQATRKAWAMEVFALMGYIFDETYIDWDRFVRYATEDEHSVERAAYSVGARYLDGSLVAPPALSVAAGVKRRVRPPLETRSAMSSIINAPESAERINGDLSRGQTRECPQCHNPFQVTKNESLYTCPKCDFEFSYKDMANAAGVVDPYAETVETVEIRAGDALFSYRRPNSR